MASGFEFWKTKLGGAQLVVAPMVDQSELAWRLLSRRHGAQLCYTPMYHASVFIRDVGYRREALMTCSEDRPLIVQFCANEPQTLLKAAQYAEPHCEAVDLNLGCPQSIAKRGHYGAFLQDEWDLVHNMVSLCAKELKVPITCKIRVFEDVEKTVRYAQMLESAGCQLLTVHGRTREQKGPLTGLASWKHIAAVKAKVKIPVFANGNIQYLGDAHRCMTETGVDGVMSAEGNLYNPVLFEGKQAVSWEVAEEYLNLVDEFPCPLSYVRGHVFKICHFVLQAHPEMRDKLGWCKSRDEIREVVKTLKEKSQDDFDAYKSDPESLQSDLAFPYWMCQPYVRPSPEESKGNKKANHSTKRPFGTPGGADANSDQNLSKNKLKKMKRNPNKAFEKREEKFVRCEQCPNPKGQKCVYSRCKACCKKHVTQNLLDCSGHKFWWSNRKSKEQPNSDTAERDKTVILKSDKDETVELEQPLTREESDSSTKQCESEPQNCIPDNNSGTDTSIVKENKVTS